MTEPQEQPEQRSARHAAPRTPARVRLRGRALAMAAVPTALLMAAAYTPSPAVAEPSGGKPCATAPESVPDVAPVEETPVPKSELPEPPGPSATPTGAPTTAPTTVPTQVPTAAPSTAPTAPAPTDTPTDTPTAAGGAGTAAPAGLVDDLLGGVTHLADPGGSPGPTAGATATPPASGPSATTAPTAPTAAARAADPVQPAPPASSTPTADGGPTAAPSSTPSSTTSPQASSGPKAPGGGKASPRTTPSAAPSAASGSPSANPNCAVDARGLTAGAAAPGHVVPEQNWTLRSSRLGLHGAVFHGVYDVKTPTGTKRVLKFVVDTVDIENLDMSTLEGNGKTFHVKSADGSTSTMRKGAVTMYVERLSGHLSKVLGLPLPIDLGELTLTPDTLPRWLYDLIGSVPVPLDLELTGVTAKQAGQFGGTLRIPGMRLYNDDEPYSNT
ncbi:hypothetical protein [Kitasatospora sp. NPDC088548]|uniref:hypothetical protein n=1 Tax=Kitasatospora sp. NPDC088548 TaxID=3364075 RepID=UPI00382202DC